MLGNHPQLSNYEYVAIHEICHHLEYIDNIGYHYIKRWLFRKGTLILKNQRIDRHEEFADDCAHYRLYGIGLKKKYSPFIF